MASHDNYEKNLLKALQDIAKSLKSIDSALKMTTNNEKEKTESDLLECMHSVDTTVLPLNNKYKAILELGIRLAYENIPHELIRLFDGWQICYTNANDKTLGVVEHFRSYGQDIDKMEAFGYGIDGVKGYLDVDTALELFRNVHTERLQKGGELE